MNNLTQRIITAVLGGAAVIFLIVFESYTFLFFVLGLNILGINEFYSIAGIKKGISLYYSWVVTTLLMIAFYYMEEHVISFTHVATLLPLFFGLFLIQLFRKDNNPTNRIGLIFLAIVYVTVPLLFFISIGYARGSYSYRLILGILFLIWSNDTGAYFAGKSLGKTKLFERISPKKTWEGSIGGLILSLIVGFVLSKYWHDLDIVGWLGVAVITTIFGGLGDLVESMMKRDFDIKDSGNTIPGHGGILDRFDALLLATPFVYFYLMLLVLL